MSKILVAISSCEFYETSGLNSPMRETWLPEAVKLGMDVKFFHGRGSTPKDDVVVLDVVDELYGLSEKLKFKIRWALEKGYTHVFSCFPDTYACPERLLASGFEKYDYLGNSFQHPGGAPFCQGGPGYMLSRKACEVVAKEHSSYLNDDCWIADVLVKEGICPVHHAGFTAFGPGPLRTNSSITNHLSTQPGGFTGQNMREEHQRWLAS
jgi:hypothetical protein